MKKKITIKNFIYKIIKNEESFNKSGKIPQNKHKIIQLKKNILDHVRL